MESKSSETSPGNVLFTLSIIHALQVVKKLFKRERYCQYILPDTLPRNTSISSFEQCKGRCAHGNGEMEDDIKENKFSFTSSTIVELFASPLK